MLYLVRMDVNLPHDMSVAQTDDIKAPEDAYAQHLQRARKHVAAALLRRRRPIR